MEDVKRACEENGVFLGPGTKEENCKLLGTLNVDMNRPFDQNCYLTTHNAYAAKNYGWVYFQQHNTVTDQLKMGVRALQLDIYAKDGNIFLMHGGETTSKYIKPFSECSKLSDIFQEVKQFLDENRSEVVTCFFETYVDDPALVSKAIDEGGVRDYIFWCNGENGGRKCPPWPTLKEMVDLNKRLVLLSYKWDGTGLPCQWGFCVETVYGDACCDKAQWAKSRAEHYPLEHENSMCLMNHFPDKSFTLLEGVLHLSRKRNSTSNILAHVEDVKCARGQGRLPTFISVDMHEEGDEGGPAVAVAKVNAMYP